MADKILQLGDDASSVRFKDLGNGTVAEVLAAGISTASAAGDRLVSLGDGSTKVRLRDMGDGTFSEVIFGV